MEIGFLLFDFASITWSIFKPLRCIQDMHPQAWQHQGAYHSRIKTSLYIYLIDLLQLLFSLCNETKIETTRSVQSLNMIFTEEDYRALYKSQNQNLVSIFHILKLCFSCTFLFYYLVHL